MRKVFFSSASSLSVLAVIGTVLLLAAPAYSQTPPPNPVTRGAGLFDNWIAFLGVPAPVGNMPIWSRQSSNTVTGPDTWRCVNCHGWDYQGKDGAYRSGTHFTGFPGVLQITKGMTEDDIVAHLKGSLDPAHDFSKFIDNNSLSDLAHFLKTSLVDDNAFIDPVTFKVKDGDPFKGKDLYQQVCATCHGADGSKTKIRFEGLDASLGIVAARDPWRFLHKTRFGTPGTPMAIGFDLGWTAQEGRNVLAYAQTLPGAIAEINRTPVMQELRVTPAPNLGGPPRSVIGSILTALAAMATGLGFNILLFGALIGIILLLVWALRGRHRS